MYDALLLSRIQFAANISFHILFPTITIALGWLLLFFKVQYNRTKKDAWINLYFFWVKVFALSFAMGVVSGITMSFQFGTNWPGFMETVGNIAGPLLAYEVLTAFFLEAVFIGVMLFGFSKVPNWLHTTATFLVAFGTTMSAFWILVLNSWMHTPAGYEIRDGVIHAANWFEIIFNPSLPYRLTHTLIASGLTVAFLVAGVSVIKKLMKKGDETVGLGFKTGTYLAAFLIPIQIIVGDMHGLNTLEHQPAKVAAMEGNWETQGNVPLLLFAIPDEESRTNSMEIGIPNGASLILKHDPEGVVPGLNEFVLEDGTIKHPPVAPVFWSFRIMVGTGMAMLVLSWAAAWQIYRKRTLNDIPKPIQYAFVPMTFAGWIATLSGWYVTEIGRQPWLVTGVLTTRDAVGDVAGGMVFGTLVAWLVVYVFLLSAYIGTILHLIRKHGESKDVNSTNVKTLTNAMI